MAVGAHAEHEQVEAAEGALALGEAAHQVAGVAGGGVLGGQFAVDAVHVVAGDGDLGEESVVHHVVVAVVVVGGDAAFVPEPQVHAVPVQGLGQLALGEDLVQALGGGAAGEGHVEGAAGLDGLQGASDPMASGLLREALGVLSDVRAVVHGSPRPGAWAPGRGPVRRRGRCVRPYFRWRSGDLQRISRKRRRRPALVDRGWRGCRCPGPPGAAIALPPRPGPG